jgi:predicted phosphoribosyltransferase
MQLAMDIFVVRKLGVPGHEELSMGAIASGGVRMLNEDAIRSLNTPDQQIAIAGAQAHRELQDCETAYRGNYQELDIQGHEVILVDDGLATGASMIAAVAAIKAQHPARLTAAVPTGSLEACRKLQTKVDALVCIIRPEPFYSVGYWYEDYSAVTAEQIKQLLGKTRR